MENNTKSPGGGWESNTHPTSYFNKSVCIDYLKFRFAIDYKENGYLFDTIFNELFHIARNEIVTTKINSAYSYMSQLAVGIYVLYGSKRANTKDDKATCVLELKGSGCREFEDRYYNLHKDRDLINKEAIVREGWIRLLEECLELRGKCTRIDIPTDDFSGLITADEIKKKIHNREYTTRMRRLELINSNNEEDVEIEIIDDQEKLIGMNSIVDSKLSGYSATFGDRKHLQLCIYDKYAEQTKRGFPCKAKSWIRYEVRYYHKNAESEIPLLLMALKRKEESKHIVSCLAGLFEFKEPNMLDAKNRSHAKVWSKWIKFIGDVGKQGAFAGSPSKTSIMTTIEWLLSACSIALAKVVIAVGAPMNETIGAILISGLKRMDNAALIQVNQQRRKLKLQEFKNVEKMVHSLLLSEDFPESFSPNISELFFVNKNK